MNMGKFDEPIGPIPPLSRLERRWLRNCLVVLLVLVAVGLFAVVSLAEVPASY